MKKGLTNKNAHNGIVHLLRPIVCPIPSQEMPYRLRFMIFFIFMNFNVLGMTHKVFPSGGCLFTKSVQVTILEARPPPLRTVVFHSPAGSTPPPVRLLVLVAYVSLRCGAFKEQERAIRETTVLVLASGLWFCTVPALMDAPPPPPRIVTCTRSAKRQHVRRFLVLIFQSYLVSPRQVFCVAALKV